jgi:hypothetical protein
MGAIMALPNSPAMQRLCEDLMLSGHGDDVKAFEIVDFYMTEYLTTPDPLSENAKLLQSSLHGVVKEWTPEVEKPTRFLWLPRFFGERWFWLTWAEIEDKEHSKIYTIKRGLYTYVLIEWKESVL